MELGPESPKLEIEGPPVKAEGEEIESKSTTAAQNTPGIMSLEQQRNPGTQASEIRSATPLRYNYSEDLHFRLSSELNEDKMDYPPRSRFFESSTVSTASMSASAASMSASTVSTASTSASTVEHSSRSSGSMGGSFSPSAKPIYERGSAGAKRVRLIPKAVVRQDLQRGRISTQDKFPARSKYQDRGYRS